MNTRIVSWIFGVIFVAVGILGFTPNGLVGYDGIFAVNAVHNLVHLLTGMVFLVGVIKYKGYEGRLLKIVGVAYVAVTILGFLTSGDMMLSIIHINEADRWLHLGLAIAILSAGFLPASNNTRLTANAIGTQ